MLKALGSAVAYALLAALLLSGASAAHARTEGWDAVVDLDRETSCRPIVAALQRLLESKVSSRFVKVTGSLTGTADAIAVGVIVQRAPEAQEQTRCCSGRREPRPTTPRSTASIRNT